METDRRCVANHNELSGALKAWATIGAKQFMRLQMSSNPVDEKYELKAENVREYEHALKTATVGGVSVAIQDLSLLFEDWLPDIAATSLDITIMHGVEDKVATIDSIRDFAAEFSEKVELIELKNAGMPLLLSHTNEVINLMRTVVDAQLDKISYRKAL